MHIYISGNPGVYLHLCSPIDLSYDWWGWGGGLVILERPVHLLHVGEHHLGVEAARADHFVHVLARDEVGDARQPPGGSSRNKGNMQGTCSGQGRSWSCHAHHRCLISILTLQSGMPTRNSVFYSLPTAWKSQKPEGKEMLTVRIWLSNLHCMYLGKEVMYESAECQSIGPRVCEILNFDILKKFSFSTSLKSLRLRDLLTFGYLTGRYLALLSLTWP